MLKSKPLRLASCLKAAMLALFSLAFACSVAGQSLVSDESLSIARRDCLQNVEVDCLLLLALSYPAPEPSPFNSRDDGSGGELYILRRLGFIEEANALVRKLPASPASLMRENEFEAATDLLIERQKGIIYEHWSSSAEAIVMIAEEHLRRGDVETAIEVATSTENNYPFSTEVLKRLFNGLLRQSDFDTSEKIAFAMTNQSSFPWSDGGGGPRDRALNELVVAYVERGEIENARILVDEIVGFPDICEAARSLSFGYVTAGDMVSAQGVLDDAFKKLESFDDQSLGLGACALVLAHRQLELGAQVSAQISADFADETFNLRQPRDGRSIVPDAYVVYFSELAVVQENLGRHDKADAAFEIARTYFDGITRPHPNIPAKLWLTYAEGLTTELTDESYLIGRTIDAILSEPNSRFFHAGRIEKFGEALAVLGDYRTAVQIADQITGYRYGALPAYHIKDRALSELALRGNLAAARELASKLRRTQNEDYQYEQGQRWVARAAYNAGDEQTARQILVEQMISGPREQNLLVADQKKLGFNDDLRQSYQIILERILESPNERIRFQLISLASTIEMR